MSKATKIYNVVVQIHGPSGDYPGQVAEGRYTVDDNTVTLVNHLGTPVRDSDGKTYTRKLDVGDDAYKAAARLTKQFRSARRGKERVEGFSRPLHYPKMVY